MENESTIQKIRKDYEEKGEDKVETLRKLDKKAKQPAEITAFTLGIIAALILGVGMCLTMGVIGAGGTAFYAVGIVAGIIGIALAVANYFIYKAILKSGKAKYGAQILQLSEQLLNGNN
ncbi:MAG: dihydropteridine reductase [Clostridia bacterium]|nr:dihydropteridine reductase [Clostridia bacterium]